MWIFLGLLASLTLAIVSIIDKKLLDRHLPNVTVLYFWTAIGMVCYSVVVFIIFGLPLNESPTKLLISLGSGLALGLGIALMFWGLKREEASRAIAIVNTNPLFVVLLAIPLLGEYLSPIQWGSLILILIGGSIISLTRSANQNILAVTKSTPILFLSSFCWGLAHFTSKYVLEDLPTPTVFALQQIGVAIILFLATRKATWKQFVSVMKRRDTLMLMLIGEGIIPYIGIGLGLLAINTGPVSLVSPLLATRPMFVFVLATTLSHPKLNLMNEPFQKNTIITKFAAISIILSGIVFLSIG